MIYFIQQGKAGAVKIGYSATKEGVQERLAMLQTGSPKILHILSLINGNRKTEHTLHKKFQQYRLQGEWFQPNETLINFINQTNRLTDNEIILKLKALGIIGSHSITILKDRTLCEIISEIEKNYIKLALSHTQNNKASAAKLLGISRSTLYQKINNVK